MANPSQASAVHRLMNRSSFFINFFSPWNEMRRWQNIPFYQEIVDHQKKLYFGRKSQRSYCFKISHNAMFEKTQPGPKYTPGNSHTTSELPGDRKQWACRDSWQLSAAGSCPQEHMWSWLGHQSFSVGRPPWRAGLTPTKRRLSLAGRQA